MEAAAAVDLSKYVHSPVHMAVLRRDYVALKRTFDKLPRLAESSAIRSESDSVAEEEKADAISALIDRRDVPNRETPLHVAVKLGDATSTEMLMAAGADWSLQNDQGWNALQEAICSSQEALAKIIVRHSQPLAWAKWCRRLPRLVSTMQRMRDFYMEITFHFESSVIPFISRIAPSDTYKIWKRGSNLRADMTLAGFDGFRIQRSDQSILFLGDGSEDRQVLPGSLCMINHKDKEVMNALEGAGTPASEAEVQQEVAAMLQTNIFRPGIDVTQAVLLPQLTWRRQQRTEMVGPWRAKVYDMQHVIVSVKSRCIQGAMTDHELLSSHNDNDADSNDFNGILTEEERKQLQLALTTGSPDLAENDAFTGPYSKSCNQREIPVDSSTSWRQIPVDDTNTSRNSGSKVEKRGWLGNWGKKHQSAKPESSKRMEPPRSSLYVDEKVSNLLDDSPASIASEPTRHSMSLEVVGWERETQKSLVVAESGRRPKEGGIGKESEFKKGLKPVLWLSPSFPLRTEELLPLLDILADKVKAIRRLRDLLTTKLPPGTFPVKVAIPVVPTVRVIVTFTKFEELLPLEEFSTPLTSPMNMSPSEQQQQQHLSSWIHWIKAPYRQSHSPLSGPTSRVEDIQDPFAIPPDYTWTSSESKRKQVQVPKRTSTKGRGNSSQVK